MSAAAGRDPATVRPGANTPAPDHRAQPPAAATRTGRPADPTAARRAPAAGRQRTAGPDGAIGGQAAGREPVRTEPPGRLPAAGSPGRRRATEPAARPEPESASAARRAGRRPPVDVPGRREPAGAAERDSGRPGDATRGRTAAPRSPRRRPVDSDPVPAPRRPPADGQLPDGVGSRARRRMPAADADGAAVSGAVRRSPVEAGIEPEPAAAPRRSRRGDPGVGRPDGSRPRRVSAPAVDGGSVPAGGRRRAAAVAGAGEPTGPAARADSAAGAGPRRRSWTERCRVGRWSAWSAGPGRRRRARRSWC